MQSLARKPKARLGFHKPVLAFLHSLSKLQFHPTRWSGWKSGYPQAPSSWAGPLSPPRVSGSLPQAELLIEGEKTNSLKDPSTSWPQPLPLLTLPQPPHWPSLFLGLQAAFSTATAVSHIPASSIH